MVCVSVKSRDLRSQAKGLLSNKSPLNTGQLLESLATFGTQFVDKFSRDQPVRSQPSDGRLGVVGRGVAG